MCQGSQSYRFICTHERPDGDEAQLHSWNFSSQTATASGWHQFSAMSCPDMSQSELMASEEAAIENFLICLCDVVRLQQL